MDQSTPAGGQSGTPHSGNYAQLLAAVAAINAARLGEQR